METKHVLFPKIQKSTVFKYVALVAVITFYMGFVISRYGISQGILVTLLTWSFFVLCTPIADAGFLLDFPIRLLFNIKMITSEIIVWAFAFALNGFFVSVFPEVYDKTLILQIFYHIMTDPKYWGIIIVSSIGTFLSVQFADELMDVIHDKYRYHYIKYKKVNHMMTLIFAILFIILLYSVFIDHARLDVLKGLM